MTITHENTTPATSGGGRLVQLWAELGHECQLACVHCYADSGPGKGFGTMTADEWEQVIRQAAQAGTARITFIGGEPTLHPSLGRLVRAAVACGLHAEIFSNMVTMTARTWELCQTPGVSLATSWYSASREEHRQITGRDTWRQTRKNITEAVRRGIPIRAGIITGIIPGQQAKEAEQELRALGVTRTGTDHLREFGRGTIADPSQACGNCGHRRAAVLPDGTVTPCPMTRWMSAGNVRDGGLSAILESVTALASTLPARTCHPDCVPSCGPGSCDPSVGCGPHPPAVENCNPTCVPDSYCNPLCTPGACKPRV